MRTPLGCAELTSFDLEGGRNNVPLIDHPSSATKQISSTLSSTGGLFVTLAGSFAAHILIDCKHLLPKSSMARVRCEEVERLP